MIKALLLKDCMRKEEKKCSMHVEALRVISKRDRKKSIMMMAADCESFLKVRLHLMITKTNAIVMLLFVVPKCVVSCLV